MNSAVMPAGAFGTYNYSPMPVEIFEWYLKTQIIESRIGYPQNIELIKTWFGVDFELNRTEVSLKPGDQMLVMRLKKRIANPTDKGKTQSDNINDWEFAIIHFS